MVKTLKKFAEFLRPIDESTNEITVVKFSLRTPTVAEVRKESNALHAENIAKNRWTALAKNPQTRS